MTGRTIAVGTKNETLRRSPRRLRRRLLRALGVLFALVAVVLALVLAILHNLDRPWLKGHLLAFAKTAASTDIDFGAIEIHELSGLRLERVVVATPGPLAKVAPDLVRIGSIEVTWKPSSLFGKGPQIERVVIHDVAITVVVDENGKTSFDGFPPSKAPPTPPTPLSQLPASIFASPLPIGRIEIDGIRITVLRSDELDEVDRFELKGLALAVDALRDENGNAVRVALGDPKKPLSLDVARMFSGETKHARLGLSLGLDADAKDAKLALELSIASQEFVEDLPTGPIAKLRAGAHFDPEKKLTEVTLDEAEIVGETARAKATAIVTDEGGALVKHLELDVDAVKLAKVAPPGFIPLEAARAELHVKVDDFDPKNPTPAATLAIDLALDDARFAGVASLGVLRAKVHGRPESGGALSASGELSLDTIRVALGDDDLVVGDVALHFSGTRANDGAIAATAALDVRSIEAAKAFGVDVRALAVKVGAKDLHPDAEAMFGVRGSVVVDVEAEGVDARRAGGVVVTEPKIHLEGPLPKDAPIALEASIDAAKVALVDGRGHAKLEEPVHVAVSLHDVELDVDDPIATRAVARVDAKIGALTTTIDATKREDDVDYKLGLKAESLGDVAKIAGPGPWKEISIALDSSGRVTRLGSGAPAIREASHLVLEHVAVGAVATRTLDVTVSSNGDAARQEGKVDLQVGGLVAFGHDLGDDRLSAIASADFSEHAFRVDLENQGAAEAKIGAFATLDRQKNAIDYDVSIELSMLSKLAPLVAENKAAKSFDLNKLALRLTSRGKAFGLLAPGPLALEATVDGTFHGIAYARDDQAIDVDEARLRATIGQDAENHTVESHLDVDSMKVAFGRHELRVTNIRDSLKAKVGKKLEEGEVSIDQLVSIDAVKQDFAPMYPVGKVEAHVVAARDDDGVIRVADIKLINGLGGTSLDLRGGLELGEDRRRLSIRGELKQDLARACTDKALFVGSGVADVTVRIESADLDVFRTRATMKIGNANIELPGPGIKLSGVAGEIPIRADVHLKKDGVELLADTEVNRYSVLRFSDQHPLLERRSFVSVDSIVTPAITIAPFAANLEIVQNVVSLGQLEMGVRGGRVTGQCIIDIAGEDSKLEAHVRVNGVQSTHGEPFDANAALVLSLGDRSVEGRAEIVRIGRRHLLDLLDVQDPQRIDGSMNQIRRALSLGYPNHIRISFDHGFASASVSFAGIASLLSIDDIRGVPMGPLVDKTVRSIWRPKRDRR